MRLPLPEQLGHMRVDFRLTICFFEQEKAYVKAIEKSTSRLSVLREVIKQGAQNE